MISMLRETRALYVTGLAVLVLAGPAAARPPVRSKTHATKVAHLSPPPARASTAHGLHAPDAYFVLQKEVGTALAARDLEKAEQASRAQMLLRPDRALPYYNLATVNALRGHVDVAIENLTHAMDRGFAIPDLLQGDPDLAALRTHPLWPKILERANSLHQTQSLAQITPVVSKTP